MPHFGYLYKQLCMDVACGPRIKLLLCRLYIIRMSCLMPFQLGCWQLSPWAQYAFQLSLIPTSRSYYSIMDNIKILLESGMTTSTDESNNIYCQESIISLVYRTTESTVK